MNIKKILGSLLLCLSAVIINSGSASMFYVGTEDMPESIKQNR
ncbi:MAG: hypothetical protein RSD47_08405 [Romboutsia sp.]